MGATSGADVSRGTYNVKTARGQAARLAVVRSYVLACDECMDAFALIDGAPGATAVGRLTRHTVDAHGRRPTTAERTPRQLIAPLPPDDAA